MSHLSTATPPLERTVRALFRDRELRHRAQGIWPSSKVSRVAVLLGLGIGAAIGGIIGALLALPVVAAYPIVERIWLRESLGKHVLAEHARLEHEGE
jgi:ABC-type nitrate/sulfonate/bicarbonate transport system permease component